MAFLNQYKLSYTVSNNIVVYEEPVSRAKKMPQCAVKFEAGEENRIVYESLFCSYHKKNKTNTALISFTLTDVSIILASF